MFFKLKTKQKSLQLIVHVQGEPPPFSNYDSDSAETITAEDKPVDPTLENKHNLFLWGAKTLIINANIEGCKNEELTEKKTPVTAKDKPSTRRKSAHLDVSNSVSENICRMIIKLKHYYRFVIFCIFKETCQSRDRACFWSTLLCPHPPSACMLQSNCGLAALIYATS